MSNRVMKVELNVVSSGRKGVVQHKYASLINKQCMHFDSFKQIHVHNFNKK